MTMPNELRRWL